MFETVRVINSSVPTTEPVRLRVKEGTEVVYGCALVREDGILRAAQTGEAPEYVCGSGEISLGGDILAYPVLDNIIFAAPIKGAAPEACKRGERVSVLNEDCKAVAVTPDAEGCGEITDISDKVGYVFVKFTR